jgi:hypothetical protein
MGFETEAPVEGVVSPVGICLLKSGDGSSSKDFIAFHGWIFAVDILGVLDVDERLGNDAW